jgi:hypothetical protein
MDNRFMLCGHVGSDCGQSCPTRTVAARFSGGVMLNKFEEPNIQDLRTLLFSQFAYYAALQG